MQRRHRYLLLGLATSFGLCLSVLGCGSSTKATADPLALCQSGCDRFTTVCADTLGTFAAQTATTCKATCVTEAPAVNSCTNGSAIIAAYQACLNKTVCADLTTCFMTIPACVGGTSRDGGSGTGGASTATGGTSGATGGSSGIGGASGGTGGKGGAGGLSSFFDGGIPGLDGGGHTCADLQACCGGVADVTIKAACLQVYDQVKANGDALCGVAYAQLASSAGCP